MNFKTLILFVSIFTLSIQSSLAQEGETLPTEINVSDSTTLLLTIEGMACQEGCADKISSNLMERNGVVSADISYKNKSGVITFDPKVITEEKVKNIITGTKVKNYTYTVSSAKTITAITPQSN